MDYTVAVDATGAAAAALLGAAGVSGIPHAFVLDSSGTIRYHGHPMEPRFAQALEAVCGGAAAAGSGGGGGSQPQPQRQQRELPRVTASREELLAMPVRRGSPAPLLALNAARRAVHFCIAGHDAPPQPLHLLNPPAVISCRISQATLIR
jgi:hypothetical protein